MTWYEDSNRWDTLVLGGEVWPGIWDVQPRDFARDIQLKKEKGKDGIKTRDQGMKGARVDCIGQIRSEEWESAVRLLNQITPAAAGKTRNPTVIDHPKTDALKIQNLTVKGIELDGPGPGGLVTLTLKCIQWFPEPKDVDRSKENEITEDQRAAQNALNRFQLEPDIKPGRDAVNAATWDDTPLPNKADVTEYTPPELLGGGT